MSVSLTLAPAFGTLFFLLGCLSQSWCWYTLEASSFLRGERGKWILGRGEVGVTRSRVRGSCSWDVLYKKNIQKSVLKKANFWYSRAFRFWPVPAYHAHLYWFKPWYHGVLPYLFVYDHAQSHVWSWHSVPDGILILLIQRRMLWSVPYSYGLVCSFHVAEMKGAPESSRRKWGLLGLRLKGWE